MVFRKKIANSLRKMKLMMKITDNKDSQFWNQLKTLFLDEWQFLRYPEIYSYEDIENLL